MSTDGLQNFGFLLKDVSRLSSLNFERHAVELDLTLTQCKVLAHLQRNRGITQVQLAERCDIDQMTLVRLIDRMHEWVERGPHPTDRRARCLFLKPAAAPVLQQMWRLADRARAAALAGLSQAEKAQLMNLLERVHANLNSLVADREKTPAAAVDGRTAARRVPAGGAMPVPKTSIKPAKKRVRA